MDKKTLRQTMIARREAIDPDERAHRSQSLCGRLLAMPEMRDARAVMAFVPFGAEADIRPVVERLWTDGKAVLLPKINRAAKQLDIYRVEGWDELQSGVWGIREPGPGSVRWNGHPPLDLIVMPGLAFDAAGGRLGYGGGFYDRLLAAMQRAEGRLPLLVGVAFSIQIAGRVPVEQWDIPVDRVVTDEAVIATRS